MKKPPLQPPFKESYWVIQDQFLAGKHPLRSLFPSTGNLQSLLHAGISVFVDLSGGLDYSQDLAVLDASALDDDPQYLPFPITDFTVPEPTYMAAILDAIDLAIQSGKKVYVHCFAGHGRTGTVVGCHLARHGITGDAALEKIRLLRAGVPGNFSSPENDYQKKMVTGWREGQ